MGVRVLQATKSGAAAPSASKSAASRRASWSRVTWVDSAKGLCILLVVMGHAITELQAHGYYTGWWPEVNYFLGPIRMPLFFMLAGLFAGKALKESWHSLAHRRIWVMVWLYIIWVPARDLVLLFMPYTHVGSSGIVYPPPVEDTANWIPAIYNGIHAFVEPTSYLWFLWALALFSIAARATRHVHPVIQIVAAAFISAWEPFETISWSWDFVTKMYLFYLVGMYGARIIFEVVDRFKGLFFVVSMAAFGGVAMWVQMTFPSFNEANVGSLRVYLSLTGALCAISIMSILQGTFLVVPFEKIGRNTLPLFLMHIPMLIVTLIVFDMLLDEDPHFLMSTPVLTIIAAILCLVMHKLLVRAGAGWLFRRPQWFINLTTPTHVHSPSKRP